MPSPPGPPILYEGTGVTTTVIFTNPDSVAPVDPTAVTMAWAVNGGSATVWTYLGTGSIVKDEVGVYYALLDTTDTPGSWVVKWEGTGTCPAVGLQSFTVMPTPF
jgi:hypothetical protein